MFVIVFGQLTLVLFFEKANTYGSVFSFFLALLLRLLCGDEKMNLDRVISFGTIYSTTKMCDGVPCEGEVPFRTIVTIIGIVSQYLHLNFISFRKHVLEMYMSYSYYLSLSVKSNIFQK